MTRQEFVAHLRRLLLAISPTLYHRSSLVFASINILMQVFWLIISICRDEPVPHRRSIRRYAEKLGNGFQRLSPLGGLYICHPPAI